MTENTLVKYHDVVGEEIETYESIEELYNIKQSILVQGKSDALWDVDAKILTKLDQIRELEIQRKTVAQHMGNEEITLSEIIEKAKNSDAMLAEKLQKQKSKLVILAKTIKLQENTNIELVKHGLVMVGKRFDIILNMVAPQTKSYNMFGQNVKTGEMQISSVIEEV